jgi:membrane protein
VPLTRQPGGLTWKELPGRIWPQFWKHRVLDQSAMLSFYFLLAMFPLLIFLIALLGLLLESGPVLQETLHQYLAAVIPDSTSTLIDTTLGEIARGSDPLTLSSALVFTWWAASQGMLAIIDSLNVAYEVEESRPWWKKYLLASALTIVWLALLASGLLFLIYGDRLNEFMASQAGYSGFIAGVWPAFSWLLVLAFVVMAFNLLYVYAPNVEHRRWRWLMPGTVVGVGLWLLASYGFQLYLRFFNRFSVTYGSIGAVIILLLWLYLSGIAILVGGEVNSEIDKASRRPAGR